MNGPIHGDIEAIGKDAGSLQEISDQQAAIMKHLGSTLESLAPAMRGGENAGKTWLLGSRTELTLRPSEIVTVRAGADAYVERFEIDIEENDDDAPSPFKPDPWAGCCRRPRAGKAQTIESGF